MTLMEQLDEIEEQGDRVKAILMANTERIHPEVGVALAEALASYSDSWLAFAECLLEAKAS